MNVELDEIHEQWSCGHIATSVCAECQKILIQKLNSLTAEVDRLEDLVAQYEIIISNRAEARVMGA
jgi:hypothetical protein